MPSVAVHNYNKKSHSEKYSLLHQIQTTLDKNIDINSFLKLYKQWFQKLVSLKSLAFIVFKSGKNMHVIYDIFPKDFQVLINRQLEEGIIFWAGQQRRLFLSEQKIFLPLHCHNNYIGIIEIVPKIKLENLNRDVTVLLEIVGNLIANYFYKNQFERMGNLRELRPDSELFHLALLGAISNGIIHEISNPLTTIVGRSGLLLNNPKRLKYNLAIIEKEAARINGTVHEYLAVSKIHNIKEKEQEIDINRIIKRSVLFLDHYAILRQAEIKLHLQQKIATVSVNYFSFLGFLIKIIFSQLILLTEPQTIKIRSYENEENVCIEIDANLSKYPGSGNLSAGYSVTEKNGKILIQLPVLSEAF